MSIIIFLESVICLLRGGMGVGWAEAIPKSLPVLSTKPVLRKVAVDRAVRMATEECPWLHARGECNFLVCFNISCSHYFFNILLFLKVFWVACFYAERNQTWKLWKYAITGKCVEVVQCHDKIVGTMMWIYRQVYMIIHCLCLYSKIPLLRLSKSGLKDHFWTVPKVVSNQR